GADVGRCPVGRRHVGFAGAHARRAHGRRAVHRARTPPARISCPASGGGRRSVGAVQSPRLAVLVPQCLRVPRLRCARASHASADDPEGCARGTPDPGAGGRAGARDVVPARAPPGRRGRRAMSTTTVLVVLTAFASWMRTSSTLACLAAVAGARRRARRRTAPKARIMRHLWNGLVMAAALALLADAA